MTVPDSGTFNWTMMKNCSVELMFMKRDELIKEVPAFEKVNIGGSLTFYIDVEGVKVLYDKVKNNVEIVKELHNVF